MAFATLRTAFLALSVVERHDLGHAVLAVFALDVLDDLAAPALAEVDVDIRHAHALGVLKTARNTARI
jgi:hypothetical protein